MKFYITAGFIELPKNPMNKWERTFIVAGNIRVRVYSNSHNNYFKVVVMYSYFGKVLAWVREWEEYQVINFLRRPDFHLSGSDWHTEYDEYETKEFLNDKKKSSRKEQNRNGRPT